MAVLCGLSGGSAGDVMIAVLSAGLEKENINPVENQKNEALHKHQ